MSDYTPDTTTVRSIFADYWHDEAISSGSPLREQNREEFDRWLATVKAEAWDEGIGDAWQQPRATNPYKEAP